MTHAKGNPKYPGYRTMTGVERRNARMHRMFETARELEAQREARHVTLRAAILQRMEVTR